MLSILIPIYNFPCTDLVTELQRQAALCNVPFEIVLMDDASTLYKKDNRTLAELTAVRLIDLKENIGRAKIRNRLADEAKYDCLLFMDVDVRPISEHYIQNYLDICADYPVVFGGRSYSEHPPKEKNLYFHWLVGSKREVLSAEKRQMNANKSFMTNNFLIHKDTFNSIRFDESISTYGHEDTLFGFELKKQGIRIHHINNPLEHIGLEENHHFIAKTKTGIDNLHFIILKHQYADEMTEDIALLKSFRLVKKLRLQKVLALLYRHLHTKIEQHLTGEKPSLLLFDLYKLSYLCSLSAHR
jgi:glycosyltransferase involved in cell wall biosynthesis